MGLRFWVPPKITSSILPPRRFLVDCSPMTQRMASAIFDFPLPLGPTTAVMAWSKVRRVFWGKDLNPCSSKALKYKGHLAILSSKMGNCYIMTFYYTKFSPKCKPFGEVCRRVRTLATLVGSSTCKQAEPTLPMCPRRICRRKNRLHFIPPSCRNSARRLSFEIQ